MHALLDRYHRSGVGSTFAFADAFLQVLIHSYVRPTIEFDAYTRKHNYTCNPSALLNAPILLKRPVTEDFVGFNDEA